MTFSDVIAQMLCNCYGWQDAYPPNQSDLTDFVEIDGR